MNKRIHPIAAAIIVAAAIGLTLFLYGRIDTSGRDQRPAGSMPPGIGAEFGRRMQGGMPKSPVTKSAPAQAPGSPGRQ